MKTPFIKSKRGFTIIEVSLVLAIGGLIMLMVFIAWPAVQRNQRDSQRRSTDLPRLYTALVNFATNNKGAIPKTVNADAKQVLIPGSELAIDITQNSELDANWVKFYNNYLIFNGVDTFADPASGPYGLNVISCSAKGKIASKPNDTLTKGDGCDNASVLEENGKTIFQSGDNAGILNLNYEDQGAYITLVIGAYCDGEQAKAATSGAGGVRNYAIMYNMEAGGVYCQSN